MRDGDVREEDKGVDGRNKVKRMKDETETKEGLDDVVRFLLFFNEFFPLPLLKNVNLVMKKSQFFPVVRFVRRGGFFQE